MLYNLEDDYEYLSEVVKDILKQYNPEHYKDVLNYVANNDMRKDFLMFFNSLCFKHITKVKDVDLSQDNYDENIFNLFITLFELEYSNPKELITISTPKINK